MEQEDGKRVLRQETKKVASKAPMLLNVPSGGLNTHNKQAYTIHAKNIGAPPCFDGNKDPLYECVADATPKKKGQMRLASLGPMVARC